MDGSGEWLGIGTARAGKGWLGLGILSIPRGLSVIPGAQLSLRQGATAAAQKEAKAARRGIWAGNPVAPWEWRRQHR